MKSSLRGSGLCHPVWEARTRVATHTWDLASPPTMFQELFPPAAHGPPQAADRLSHHCKVHGQLFRQNKTQAIANNSYSTRKLSRGRLPTNLCISDGTHASSLPPHHVTTLITMVFNRALCTQTPLVKTQGFRLALQIAWATLSPGHCCLT